MVRHLQKEYKMNWSSKDWDRLFLKAAGIVLLVIAILCGLFFLAGRASAEGCEQITERLYAAGDSEADEILVELMRCMEEDIKRGTEDYRAVMGWKPSS